MVSGEEGDKEGKDAHYANSNREFVASSTLLSKIFQVINIKMEIFN